MQVYLCVGHSAVDCCGSRIVEGPCGHVHSADCGPSRSLSLFCWEHVGFSTCFGCPCVCRWRDFQQTLVYPFVAARSGCDSREPGGEKAIHAHSPHGDALRLALSLVAVGSNRGFSRICERRGPCETVHLLTPCSDLWCGAWGRAPARVSLHPLQRVRRESYISSRASA